MLRIVGLMTAAVFAMAAPSAGASYSFAFASGFTLPTAFDCTTASGCSAGVDGSANGQFNQPKGAVVIGSHVFVADESNLKVQVFDAATGTYERTITGGGYLAGPEGIATDGTNLYVTDVNHSTVDVFDAATGALVRAIGKNVGGSGTTVCTSSCGSASAGDGAGQISSPTGIGLYNGNVYVSDYNSRRVNVFDAMTGEFVMAFGKNVNAGAGDPDVCTTATGCQQGDNGGAAGVVWNSRGLAVSSTGVVYALEDENNHRISVFDATTGAFQYAFGKDVNPAGGNTCTTVTGCQSGTPSGEAGVFSYVRGAHISGGQLYVTDAGNSRVQVFDAATGAFAYAIGKNVKPGGGNRCTAATGCQPATGGEGAGETSGAYGLGVGGGKAYVADTGNQRVTVFNLADGAFVHAFGVKLGSGPCTTICARGAGGNGPGRLNRAFGTDVFGDEVLVADGDNSRVTVFDAATGAYTRTFDTNAGNGGLAFPTDVAVSGTHAYVAEGNGDRISVWDAATGTFERAFGKDVGGPDVDTCTSSCSGGTRGTGAGFMQASYGVTVGGGYVFVGDYLNRRVDQFTTAGTFVRAFGDGVNAGSGDPDVCMAASGCQEGTGSIIVGPGFHNGEVYVPEVEKAMIRVYDPATGALVRAFGKNVGGSGLNTCTSSCGNGTASSSAGALSSPWKIAFLGANAYVSDAGNKRVSVFDASTGAFRFAIGKDVDSVTADDFCTTHCTSGQWSDGAPGGLLEPRGLAAGPDGTVYVADDGGQRLAAFTTLDDLAAPTTTDNVPAGYQSTPVSVTLTASETVTATYYTTGVSPAEPTTGSAVYSASSKPTLADGQRIRYFSVDVAGNAETPHSSTAVHVDTVAPTTTDDVPSSGTGSATVTLNPTDAGSGLDRTYYTTGSSPALPTTGSTVYDPASKPRLHDGERIRYFSTDLAGNAETPHQSSVMHLPTADASSSSLTFGSVGSPVPQGTAAAPQSITLTNSGTGSLLITGFAFSGTSGGDFFIGSDTCRGAIAAGATCAFTVRFAPQGQGARSATLTVLINAFAFTTVTLSGTGGSLAAGPAGSTGATGPAGADGRTILSGTGVPSSGLGSSGDYYLDTAASRLYGPKNAGAWGSGVVLIGTVGATGPGGADGASGAAGAKGLSGVTGPKGDKGDAGPQGPAGKSSRCVVLNPGSAKQKIRCTQIGAKRVVVSTRLSRGRTVYASGHGTSLRARRPIKPGDYLLTVVTLRHGHRVVTRTKVSVLS